MSTLAFMGHMSPVEWMILLAITVGPLGFAWWVVCAVYRAGKTAGRLEELSKAAESNRRG